MPKIQPRRFTSRALLLTFFLLPGCVNLTVNVYFPEPEIREEAEIIESEIRGTNLGADGSETSWRYDLRVPGGAVLAFALRDRLAYGQEKDGPKIDIDIETPSILKLRESRKKRYKGISPYLDEGRFGEGLDGYLKLRDAKGLKLKDIQELKKLINKENEDREALYREIAEAHKISKKEIERIEKNFAEAIRNTMEPGHYFERVQKDDKEKTEWVIKPEPKKKKED